MRNHETSKPSHTFRAQREWDKGRTHQQSIDAFVVRIPHSGKCFVDVLLHVFLLAPLLFCGSTVGARGHEHKPVRRFVYIADKLCLEHRLVLLYDMLYALLFVSRVDHTKQRGLVDDAQPRGRGGTACRRGHCDEVSLNEPWLQDAPRHAQLGLVRAETELSRRGNTLLSIL